MIKRRAQVDMYLRLVTSPGRTRYSFAFWPVDVPHPVCPKRTKIFRSLVSRKIAPSISDQGPEHARLRDRMASPPKLRLLRVAEIMLPYEGGGVGRSLPTPAALSPPIPTYPRSPGCVMDLTALRWHITNLLVCHHRNSQAQLSLALSWVT